MRSAAGNALAARRIVASSRSLDPEDRLDLLVHALAQLPDAVTLAIHGDGPGRTALATLARAYGIEDRVEISPGEPEDGDGQLVYASPRNAATAPARPESWPGAVFVDSAPAGPARAGMLTTMAELIEALSCPGDPPASTRAKDELLAGERVALVTNLPTHYRVPLFNAVARRLHEAGASFRVLFLSPADAARPWMTPESLDFEHEFLTPLRVPGGARVRRAPLGLEARLAAFAPTLLVAGGFSPLVAGRAARYADREGIAFGVWSGEIRSRPTARGRLRRLERQWIVRRASFAIAYGFESAEYLRELAPCLPAVYARNTTRVGEPAPRKGRGSTVEVLTVARAVRGKALDSVIDAFRLLRGRPCRLTVAGGGPDLPALVRRADGNPAVRFLGAVPSSRVLEAFASADVFLFPSRFDVFGLVLVEAMGAGLATVVSRAPGAVADLAVYERNCLVVERDEPAAWAEAVQRLVAEPGLRRALGESAAATIGNRWTLEHSADAMVAGLRLGALSRGSGLRVAPAEARTGAGELVEASRR